jgi:cell filamentation protein
VLRNLLGISDAADFKEAEENVSYYEIAVILAEQPWTLSEIDFGLLLEIHRRIFGGVYTWAGELRTIEISKGNTRFAFSQYLDTLGGDLFARLEAEGWLAGLGRTEFVERLAWYYSESNILHPFREGTGRAIRTLLSVLAFQADGAVIAWDQMSSEENVEATAHAYANDESKLVAMLDRLIP